VEKWNWETILRIIGLKICRIRWKKTQNKGYYAVQSHSRSSRSLRKPVCDFWLIVMTSYLVPCWSYRSLLFKFWTLCVYSPPPLGSLGTTYNVHIGLIGKCVLPISVNWSFFTRCYGWVATSEETDNAISLQRCHFDPKFQVERVAPTNHFCTVS